MVTHADRLPLPQPVQLFATTRLVLPYYLALKEQQSRRATITPPADEKKSPPEQRNRR